MAALERWSPYMLSILRIMAALLFLQHGLAKLIGFPPVPNPVPELYSLLWFQGIIELVGGVLLAVGGLTRPVAFILAGDMAVAYFMAHAPGSFYPIANRGDLAVIFCFVFLHIFFAGGGAWSVDRAIGRSAS